MKRVKKYQGDSFEFHQKVVNSKHRTKNDSTYKERINILENVIKRQFEEHDKLFDTDKLEFLSPAPLADDQKKDLITLYNYKTKPFQQLNDILTTGENGTRQPLCPFCTINNVNTFDHFIPKNTFAELSDHPINLIPCCSECNSKKSTNWKEGNSRKYINFYIDDLPSTQYLYANIIIADSTLNVKFEIRNEGNINNILFTRIKNHYTDLELCERFALNSDNIISELKNTLKVNQTYLLREQLKQIIIDTENKNREYYGFNYWRAILKIECCENDEIFDFLLK